MTMVEQDVAGPKEAARVFSIDDEVRKIQEAAREAGLAVPTRAKLRKQIRIDREALAPIIAKKLKSVIKYPRKRDTLMNIYAKEAKARQEALAERDIHRSLFAITADLHQEALEEQGIKKSLREIRQMLRDDVGALQREMREEEIKRDLAERQQRRIERLATQPVEKKIKKAKEKPETADDARKARRIMRQQKKAEAFLLYNPDYTGPRDRINLLQDAYVANNDDRVIVTELAKCLRRSKRFHQAAITLSELADKADHQVVQIATDYRKAKKPGEAVRILEALLKNAPATPEAQLQLGLAHRDEKQPAKAMAALADVLSSPTHGSHAVVAFAECAIQSGKGERALRTFKMHQRDDLQDPSAPRLMAVATLVEGLRTASPTLAFEGVAGLKPQKWILNEDYISADFDVESPDRIKNLRLGKFSVSHTLLLGEALVKNDRVYEAVKLFDTMEKGYGRLDKKKPASDKERKAIIKALGVLGETYFRYAEMHREEKGNRSSSVITVGGNIANAINREAENVYMEKAFDRLLHAYSLDNRNVSHLNILADIIRLDEAKSEAYVKRLHEANQIPIPLNEKKYAADRRADHQRALVAAKELRDMANPEVDRDERKPTRPSYAGRNFCSRPM